jgi:hypothetical protein
MNEPRIKDDRIQSSLILIYLPSNLTAQMPKTPVKERNKMKKEQFLSFE